VVATSEVGAFGEELRRIFQELDRGVVDPLGECSPPLDVRETDLAVEITMDLPAVSPEAVRVVAKDGAILIAGHKAPPQGRGESSFHLVERGFGRFARTVRIVAACDLGRARAVLRGGELRVTLPRIKERRGQAIDIPVLS
jgi:HSP20 family protein